LTFTLLRFGFLALLWLFVLSAIGVLRRDLATRARERDPRRRPRGVHVPSAVVAADANPVPSAPPVSRSPTRLLVVAGPLQGTALPLTNSSVLIGRAPGATLVLDDDYLSSRHARIFPQGGQWYVEDLGSTNGTFVDDEKVTGIVALRPGAGVRFGRTIVELQD
jgi:hypothetical protein